MIEILHNFISQNVPKALGVLEYSIYGVIQDLYHQTVGAGKITHTHTHTHTCMYIYAIYIYEYIYIYIYTRMYA